MKKACENVKETISLGRVTNIKESYIIDPQKVRKCNMNISRIMIRIVNLHVFCSEF